MQLNVYLHTDSVEKYEDCLVEQPPSAVQVDPKAQYRIYHIINENEKGPPWTSHLRGFVSPDVIAQLTTKLCGAIVVFRIEIASQIRFFSACFGIGHTLLDKDSIEHNFGLRTTLNSISRLRRCTAQSLGVQTRHKSIHANYSAPVRELGFDFDEEIIALASGRCPKDDLGTVISGTDSLKLSCAITFAQLPAKLLDIFKRYNEKTYRTNGYDFLDQIEMVRDRNLIAELYGRLLKKYNGKDHSALGVMAPLDASTDEVCSYRLSGQGKPVVHPEITLDALLDYAPALDVEGLHDEIRIQGLNGDGVSVTINAPLYSYLTCEVEYRRARFVLANRRWYRMETGYLERISRQLQHYLSMYRGPVRLRSWRKTKVDGQLRYDEGAYNASYKDDDDFLVLDKKKFSEKGYGRGNSVEVADLFHLPTKTLLCVKKNTRSATLSHLFAQASVSAEMMAEVESYRTKFVEQVHARWPKDKSVTLESLKDVSFAYVIGAEDPPPGSTNAEKIDNLPVFSRINMRKHVKIIRGAGHQVSLVYVSLI